jgi:DNA-binding NarL/FixJ family response regulator
MLALYHRHPTVKIVGLSVPASTERVIQLVQSGLKGLVDHEAGFNELVREISSLPREAGSCSPRVAAFLIRYVEKCRISLPAEARLSPREQDIARLLELKLSNKLIADRLNISTGTVKNHVHRILEKIAARQRSEIPGRIGKLAASSRDGNEDADGHS